MTDDQARQFNEAFAAWEKRHNTRAFRLIRRVINNVPDSIDKVGMMFWEVMWELDLHNVSKARSRFDQMKTIFRSIGYWPPDSGDSAKASVAAMALFAEARVLIDENHLVGAERILRDLESRYSEQISSASFDGIGEQVPILHGITLANLGRWSEARPFLETAAIPQGWEGHVGYYLGAMEYLEGNWAQAKERLTKAIHFGVPKRWKPEADRMLRESERKIAKG